MFFTNMARTVNLRDPSENLEVFVRLDGSLKKIWDERLRFRPFYPSVELTDNGLMFGAGTQLAPLRNDNSGAPGLDAVRDRDRILALLSAAYGRPVPFDAMRHIEGASDAWRRGDKALANIRLAYARLPRFERHEDAYPLFLAASLLKAGFSPRYLMRQSAFDATALDIEKYNPDEPRVPAGSGRESGWWTTDDSTTASDGQSGSYVQFASEDSEEEAKRKEDEKELPDAERRALNAAPRKEDVEEGYGIPLLRPLIEEGEAPAQKPNGAPQTGATSSKSLARALEAAGERRTDGTAAHHIVARLASDAAAAREVLHKYGIGLDDAENGVFLPTDQHMRLHTREYYRAINGALASAKSREETIRLLRSIGLSLRAKRFP